MVEAYRKEAETILIRIAQRMTETMNMTEDPHNAYQEFWWDHWIEAVNELGFANSIDDEQVGACDEIYTWSEDTMVSSSNEIALKLGEFVRHLNDSELADAGL
jgi:hypothetical protein